MGHLLYHRPPAEVGPFPKLEEALLSISQIPMDSGGSMTHGLRADMAWAIFFWGGGARAARAPVRSATNTPTTARHPQRRYLATGDFARTISRVNRRILCPQQFLRKQKWDKLSSRALRARAVGTRGRDWNGARLRFEWRSPRRRACSVREQREPTLCLTRRDRFPAHCVI